MLRRWFLIAAITVVASLGAAFAWSAAQSRPPLVPITAPGPLVVVSVPTLSYADTPDTRGSALWGLARQGAVGALATRSLNQHSCSLQSWLTFSAGVRTSIGTIVGETPAGQTPAACPAAPTPRVSGNVARYSFWPAWRRTALARAQPVDIGRLGTLLPPRGQCVAAAGRFAAMGAINADGVVNHYVADPRQVDLTTCPVTLISLAGPDDGYLRWLTRRLPPRATIVVAGLADDTGPEQLHAVVIAGPGVTHGLLTSTSTRQQGVVTLTDLSALVFQRLGAAAPGLPEGRVPQVQPSASPTAPVVRTTEITKALTQEHHFVKVFLPAFFAMVVLGWLVGGVAWLLGRRRPPSQRRRHRIRRWLTLVSATAAAMPVSTFVVNVVPWWRASSPRLALAVGVVSLSVVVAVIAVCGPWRRIWGGPMALLALLTGAVIGLDVSHGSNLQFLSMLGLQPVYGSRYSGMGNVAFGLFATAALVLATVVAGPLTRRRGGAHRLAPVAIAVIGIVVVLLDGYPGWGADGGGPAALIPAFSYLAISAAGLRFTPLRAFLVVVGTVVAVALLAVFDYLRGSENRTHLGDFVARLHDGKVIDSLNRVWQANWVFLTSSKLTLLVPLLLLALVVAYWSRTRWAPPLRSMFVAVPLLAPGLRAVAVVWVLGFVFNDSGTAVPPAGLMLLAPLLVLLAVQVMPVARRAVLPGSDRS